MKKLSIVLICFFVVFAIINIWVGNDVPVKPIYWLAGKLVATFILIVGMAILRYNSDTGTKGANLVAIFFWTIYVGYFLAYKPIVEYKRNICQDKYGLVFNKTRRLYGIPEIPNDWHIQYRWDKSVNWWKGEKDTIGHVSKEIRIDSVCRIEREDDEYEFKPINNVSKGLSITTYYTAGKEDSIVYYYPGDNNNHKISRQQADSIFAAEKIAKDY